MSELKRLFIAVALPGDVRQYLKTVREKLEKTGADAKWVDPSQIHLTLKFLGSTPQEKIPAILAIGKQACEGIPRIPVTLGTLGGFPSLNAPRVLWVNLNDPGDFLISIAAHLENGLEGLGFEKEQRPFQTHMTLARIRSQKNRLTLVQAAIDLQKTLKALPFAVDNITLFESRLSPKGPAYLAIERISLGEISSSPSG
ncbi:MAG: RNA 2',3'-cyclic phosphodiesterase [Candidatus Omnitrophota bacterium]